MKVFIDTNIFLDLLLKREHYENAVIIFNAVERNIFDGIVLDITLLNIDYVARKQIKNIRDFLKLLNKVFEVVGADNEKFAQALLLNNNDLEDNLQYVCAKTLKAECIISNDKTFIQGDLELLSSSAFVEKYIA